MTLEEEQAQETEYDQLRTMYASDDVNVRAEPSTDGEIFSSFYQGDQVTVVGETPHWYIVDVDDYDSNGYVPSSICLSPRWRQRRTRSVSSSLSSSFPTRHPLLTAPAIPLRHPQIHLPWILNIM